MKHIVTLLTLILGANLAYATGITDAILKNMNGNKYNYKSHNKFNDIYKSRKFTNIA